MLNTFLLNLSKKKESMKIEFVVKRERKKSNYKVVKNIISKFKEVEESIREDSPISNNNILEELSDVQKTQKTIKNTSFNNHHSKEDISSIYTSRNDEIGEIVMSVNFSDYNEFRKIFIEFYEVECFCPSFEKPSINKFYLSHNNIRTLRKLIKDKEDVFFGLDQDYNLYIEVLNRAFLFHEEEEEEGEGSTTRATFDLIKYDMKDFED